MADDALLLPVRQLVCECCGRKVERKSRQQRHCSRRCRQKANYAQKVRRGVFSTPTTPDTALPTAPPKKALDSNALQRAKTLSSTRIIGPARVIAAEVFNRDWQAAVSSDGVAIEISRVRQRALVDTEN
jgi:hypothetical protein